MEEEKKKVSKSEKATFTHTDAELEAITAQANGLARQVEEANSKIEELNNKITDINNKLLLSQADNINYRKRKDEEVSNMLKYANQDIITDIINILDNLDRAININNPSDEIKNFLVGFRMIYNQLIETLKNYGVEELDVLNKPFNSSTCEAVLVDNNNELDNDLVVEVLLKGYKLKDRVIRPAKVKVNKKGND